MDNQTLIKDFQIVAFSDSPKLHHVFFSVFALVYLVGLLGNILLITCVVTDVHLHVPLYIFLSNLSSVDVLLTSSTLPKLMDILLSGNNLISFIGCFTQLFFYLFAAATEDILLSCMAYDRYVAVCKPLHYQLIMNKTKYVLLILSTWMLASVNALFFTLSIYQMNVCNSNKIQHFFCDIKAFDRIACSHNRFRIIIYFEIVVLGLFPFMLSLSSYVKIILIITKIQTMNGRWKAFSTCSSHLTILVTFYGAGTCMYVVPPSGDFEKKDLIFSVMYTAVTPMLNPLIYSLRNTEVKQAVIKMFK
ncbi:PREDICTED: olfactory receptor 1-like [Nanorana parkeri]|uniref:olfactory receptor 1-like n=1 Tax=Nanorana parkeri TaxID=125878 RepID=UPI000854E5A5|nr:PREDICTED: olfactory receptor 1-like [Nanorana parkeri]